MILYNQLRLGFISTEELARLYKIKVISLYSKWDYYIKQLRPYAEFDEVHGGIIITKLKF